MSSFGGISFSGLGSGLDTGAIIQALLNSSRGPVNALEGRRSVLETKRSLFGDLDSLLGSLKNAADEVRTSNSFLEFTASLSDDEYLTASATSDASPGTWTVGVTSLAAAQVNRSDGRADKDSTVIGSGTVAITVGGVTTQVDVTGGTLQDIADAINAESDLAVRADILDTGDASTPYELVLTAEETGVSNGFSISTSGDTAFEDLFDEVVTNSVAAAADAEITVNGISITRSSNTITDAIPGVTLDLVKKSAGSTVTLTVATDSEATRTKIDDFVSAYNAVVEFLGEHQTRGADGETTALFGDPTLRSIRNSLRGILGSSVATTGNAEYAMLADIGFEASTSGSLTLDGEEFAAALLDDSDAVRDLLAGSAGLVQQLFTEVDDLTDSVDGLIATREDGLNDRIDSLGDAIDRSERRLELLEQRLTAQYAALESLMARLQGQGGALGIF